MEQSNDKISHWDVVEAIGPVFNSPSRERILEALQSCSLDGGSSFKELSEVLAIPKTSLAYHLKVLVGLHLVSKTYRNLEGRRDFSFYQLTDEGAALMGYLKTTFPVIGSDGMDMNGIHTREIRFIDRSSGPRMLLLEER